jgi:hypothetical protein
MPLIEDIRALAQYLLLRDVHYLSKGIAIFENTERKSLWYIVQDDYPSKAAFWTWLQHRKGTLKLQANTMNTINTTIQPIFCYWLPRQAINRWLFSKIPKICSYSDKFDFSK